MTFPAEAIETPLGPIALRFDEHGRLVEARFSDGASPRAPASPAARQLAEYFASGRRSFDLETAPQGTEFQRSVWREVAAIDFGDRRSYLEIAEALGDRNLTRAVGAANGANPLAIIVPCHRVVGADGSLTGYAGGIDRKRWLLDHEAGQGSLL